MSKQLAKTNLRKLLKQEAIDNAKRDLAIAAEWYPLEEEALEQLQPRGSQMSPSQHADFS